MTVNRNAAQVMFEVCCLIGDVAAHLPNGMI